MTDLDQPIEYIKGVGPKKAVLLHKAFEIRTVGDLLEVFPFRYVDKTIVMNIRDITEEDSWVLFRATIVQSMLVGAKKPRLVALAKDATGTIELVWFQGVHWLSNIAQPGKEFLVYGKINVFNGRINLVHPELENVQNLENGHKTLLPIYSSTDALSRSGFDMKMHRAIVAEKLGGTTEAQFPEMLPDFILSKYNFPSKWQAIQDIHFPANQQVTQQARRRLIFEEFFLNQAGLMLQKLYRKQNTHSYKFGQIGHFFNTFYHQHLPFELTNAQKRVIREIRKDMGSGFQLNRLLQGDVGSGKTIVALMASLIAVDNGFQACIMAPLEILAQQHFKSIEKLVAPLGLNVALLTGSTTKKARENILERLVNGDIHLLIGTHAVAEPPVVFKHLGLVIIDEQHRFGVEQRAALWKKATPLPPHVIVMTATPIPRTLAMSVYGDLDVSIIDELPPGRKPINTIHMYESKRLEMESMLEREIALGRQVFIVFPLIEESEKLDLENMQIGFDRLIRSFPPPNYRLSIVHGRMKNKEKDSEMQRFINNEAQILISTTVIEVGVDIPNASVMVIENADRFGLSQLHQLRGRVGRGADQSYCILMTGYKLSAEARKRIKTMVETTNGFTIAEVDMELRGPGSIEGTKQSGAINFKLANLLHHQDIFKEANETAMAILSEDPDLNKPPHQVLKNYLRNYARKHKNWSKIG